MSEPRKYFVPPPTEWGWGSVVAVAGLVIVMVVIFFTGKSPQQTLTGESPHKQLVPHASGMRGSSEYARLSEQRGITGGQAPQSGLTQGHASLLDAPVSEQQSSLARIVSRGLFGIELDKIRVKGWRRVVVSTILLLPLSMLTLATLVIGSLFLGLIRLRLLFGLAQLVFLAGLGFCHTIIWGWPISSQEWATKGGIFVIVGIVWFIMAGWGWNANREERKREGTTRNPRRKRCPATTDRPLPSRHERGEHHCHLSRGENGGSSGARGC